MAGRGLQKCVSCHLHVQVEVVNAAPDCLLWKKNTVGITAKVPGLYRLAVAFFLIKVTGRATCSTSLASLDHCNS
jgi:hypothetical protein